MLNGIFIERQRGDSLLSPKLAVRSDTREALRRRLEERYGFIIAFPILAGQIGDRPEPRPMVLDLGAIPEAQG